MTTTGGTTRARVSVVDLGWLTWRQHRWSVLSVGVAMLALFGYGATHDPRQTVDYQIYVLPSMAGIIAVFWAAPLLAREYEQHTTLLAWSQDVTPLRWLVGKAVPLAVIAVGLAAATGALASSVADSLHHLRPQDFTRFDGLHFEMSVLPQVGYVLFGFALGLALSALIRRTVPAMAPRSWRSSRSGGWWP